MKIKQYNKHFVFTTIFCMVIATFLVTLSSIAITSISDAIIYANCWASHTEQPTETKTVDNVTYTLINNEKQLAYLLGISGDTNNYMLTRNLDMGSYNWTGIGGQSTNNGFKGIFDGQNNVIKNLKYDESSLQKFSGLFSVIRGATIKNLNLLNCKTLSYYDAGSLCAYAYNSTILNCMVRDSIVVLKSNSSSCSYGGVIGEALSSTLKNLYNISASSNYYISNINPDYSVDSLSLYSGGIIGYLGGSSNISNCTNDQSISAKNYCNKAYAGGIVGLCNADIKECANYGDVTAGNTESSSSYSGGIVGFSNYAITNCFTNNAKIEAYAKEEKSTAQSFTQNEETSKLSRDGSWSTYTDWFFSLPPSGSRIIITVPAYAGGICGKGKSVTSCYVDEKTSVKGGGQYNKDTYKFALIKEYTEGNVFGRTLFEKTTVTYTVTSKYPLYIYGTSISGYRNTTLSSCYTLTNYSYMTSFHNNISASYYKSSQKRPDGWKKPSPTISQGSYGSNNKELYASGGINASSKAVDCLDRNSSVGIYCNLDYARKKIYFDAKYNHNSQGITYKPITSDITIYLNTPAGYIIPSGYRSFQNIELTKLNKNFSSSIWDTNPDINNGYPYIKTNYWINK